MLTKKRYSFKEMLTWTRWEVFGFIIQSTAIVVLYYVLDLTFLQLPWTPVALIGTAVAFMLGFQNSAAYDRIWEARKIWGGMVNASRTWGMKIQSMVTNEYAKSPATDEELTAHKKAFVYRHIAWLTALRHAMRQPRSWEVFNEHKTNREWSEIMHIPERKIEVADELKNYLSKTELDYVLTKNNKSAAILYLQSKNLKALKESGHIWEFSFLELENLLQELFSLQGKSERIKNFPYPRQYATLSHLFVWIFLILFPFGIIPEFATIGAQIHNHYPEISKYFIWLAIPFCTAVSWVFHTMKRICNVGENPFEGSANDVPISTIARGIEIDLRQLLDEDESTIPEPFPEIMSIQM